MCKWLGRILFFPFYATLWPLRKYFQREYSLFLALNYLLFVIPIFLSTIVLRDFAEFVLIGDYLSLAWANSVFGILGCYSFSFYLYSLFSQFKTYSSQEVTALFKRKTLMVFTFICLVETICVIIFFINLGILSDVPAFVQTVLKINYITIAIWLATHVLIAIVIVGTLRFRSEKCIELGHFLRVINKHKVLTSK